MMCVDGVTLVTNHLAISAVGSWELGNLTLTFSSVVVPLGQMYRAFKRPPPVTMEKMHSVIV